MYVYVCICMYTYVCIRMYTLCSLLEPGELQRDWIGDSSKTNNKLLAESWPNNYEKPWRVYYRLPLGMILSYIYCIQEAVESGSSQILFVKPTLPYIHLPVLPLPFFQSSLYPLFILSSSLPQVFPVPSFQSSLYLPSSLPSTLFPIFPLPCHLV